MYSFLLRNMTRSRDVFSFNPGSDLIIISRQPSGEPELPTMPCYHYRTQQVQRLPQLEASGRGSSYSNRGRIFPPSRRSIQRITHVILVLWTWPFRVGRDSHQDTTTVKKLSAVASGDVDSNGVLTVPKSIDRGIKVATMKNHDIATGGFFGSALKIWLISGSFPYLSGFSYFGGAAFGSVLMSRLKTWLLNGCEGPNDARRRVARSGWEDVSSCTGRSFCVCDSHKLESQMLS